METVLAWRCMGSRRLPVEWLARGRSRGRGGGHHPVSDSAQVVEGQSGRNWARQQLVRQAVHVGVAAVVP